jgi:hypothetical protein
MSLISLKLLKMKRWRLLPNSFHHLRYVTLATDSVVKCISSPSINSLCCKAICSYKNNKNSKFLFLTYKIRTAICEETPFMAYSLLLVTAYYMCTCNIRNGEGSVCVTRKMTI